MTTPQDRMPTHTSGSIDPLVQARLDRLAGRRSVTPPPASPRFAPPAPPALAPQLNSRTTPPARAKRNHAARGSRAAAVAVSLTAAGALSALFALTDGSTSGKIATASPTISTTPVAPVAPTTGATTPITTAKAAAPATAAKPSIPTAKTPVTSAPAAAPATPASKAASGLAAGSFDGEVIDTRWGPVQVAVTIANGRITNVTTLASPNDKQKSISINNRATPILRSEALSVQSANIDSVSGATYTSEGYAQSLQSALDQARGGAVAVTA